MRILVTAFQALSRLFGGTDPDAMRVDATSIGNLLDGLTPLLSQEAAAAAREAVRDLHLLPGASLTGSLQMIDPLVQGYAERAAARLVTHITEDVRAQIAAITHRAVSGHLTWSQAAAEIRAVVGLPERWARAVTAGYERAYRDAITAGKSPAQAEMLAGKHADRHRTRLLKVRAETIARTEIMAAQNMGRYHGWLQLQRAGLVPATAQKRWIVAPDGTRRGDPCPICKPLGGALVPLAETFPNGVLMPPAHPRCRCTAVLVTSAKRYGPPIPA